jgi:hypothetical protein
MFWRSTQFGHKNQPIEVFMFSQDSISEMEQQRWSADQWNLACCSSNIVLHHNKNWPLHTEVTNLISKNL